MNWQQEAQAAAAQAEKEKSSGGSGPFISLVSGQSKTAASGIAKPGSFVLSTGKDQDPIVLAEAKGRGEGAELILGMGPTRNKAALFKDGKVVKQSYDVNDEVFQHIKQLKADKDKTQGNPALGPEVMCYIPVQPGIEEEMFGILWFKNTFVNSFPGSAAVGKLVKFKSFYVETESYSWWVPCEQGTWDIVPGDLPEFANEEFNKRATQFLNPGGGESVKALPGSEDIEV